MRQVLFCVINRRFSGGKKIVNTLQTNGTCITAEWAAFFRRHGFLVGLSLDGPEDIHDEPEFLERSEESIIEAQVEITELMGNEIYLYLNIEGTSAVARVDPSSTAESGEVVEIAFDVEKIHIFDKESERTITN